MQYLRGKMMAVTSTARRDAEATQGAAVARQVQQQPNTELASCLDHLVSDLQKRKMTETGDNSEVKRVKINQSESGLRMENIVNEEWKRISLGIEQQARAVHLQGPEMTEPKMGELKRTIINKPLSESKQAGSGTGSSSRTATGPQSKNVVLSDSASRGSQDQVSAKSGGKRHRWDDPKESGKGKKREDDKKSQQKHSPSHRSSKTPPRGYQSPIQSSRYGSRHIWSLRDDKRDKDTPAGKGKSPAVRSKDVIVIDDDKSKQSTAAKAAEKSPVAKASSSGQPASSATTATAASTVPSFKFGWKAKVVKPTLPKLGVQSEPGAKVPEKGKISDCTLIGIPRVRSQRSL